MGNFELNEPAKRAMVLPSHAFHPNVSLVGDRRKGYIAWPAKQEPETNA